MAGADYSSGANPTYGTSFSAPQVSGALALMIGKRPGLTPAAAAQVLRNTARPFPTSGGSAGIRQCTAPVAGTKQGECYCTETTCGAGMLDVAQAVAAVNGPIAVVSTGSSVLLPGRTIALSGAASMAGVAAGGISQYAWSLVDGGGVVSSLAGDLSGPSVSAQASAPGHFKVRLTVTDDQGQVSTSDYRVYIADASSASVGSTSSSGGGGGGGAVDGGFLAAVLLFVIAAVRRPGPRLGAGVRE